jgi:hypothetical protein
MVEGTMMQDIITQSLAVSVIVKVVVDTIRYNTKSTNSSIWPVMAIATGIVVAFLYHLSSGQQLNTATIAQQILIGIMAAGQAIGVTELQKKAQQ